MNAENRVLVLNTADDSNLVQILSVTEDTIPETLNGESGFHILHVRMLTELILKELNYSYGHSLTDEQIEALSIASSLHDIGKSKVPQSILDYPGKLSPIEYDIVKKHSLFGAEILESCSFDGLGSDYKNYAIEIAKYHHERYDGTGYPEGLKGDEIPLSAQVVALADSYDALTSNRS